MERITDINQLKQGDKIVKVNGEDIEVLEFLCPHPHPNKKDYSLFLETSYSVISKPTFYNQRLKEEEWFLYHPTKEVWDEIYRKQIEYHKEQIKLLESYI